MSSGNVILIGIVPEREVDAHIVPIDDLEPNTEMTARCLWCGTDHRVVFNCPEEGNFPRNFQCTVTGKEFRFMECESPEILERLLRRVWEVYR